MNNHIKIVRIPVHREHLKMFFAYTGAILMGLDLAWALWGHELLAHYYASGEAFCSLSGKYGAFMSGMAAFFERIFKATAK